MRFEPSRIAQMPVFSSRDNTEVEEGREAQERGRGRGKATRETEGHANTGPAPQQHAYAYKDANNDPSEKTGRHADR